MGKVISLRLRGIALQLTPESSRGRIGAGKDGYRVILDKEAMMNTLPISIIYASIVRLLSAAPLLSLARTEKWTAANLL